MGQSAIKHPPLRKWFEEEKTPVTSDESTTPPEPEDTGSDSDPAGPVPAAPVPTAPSIEERLKGVENRIKFASPVIAVCALAAPIISAYAACQSADAAQESARAAQENLVRSGAVVWTSTTVDLVGGCLPGDTPPRAVVEMGNSGRIATRIEGVTLGVRAIDMPDKPEAYITLGSHDEPEKLEPQDGLEISIALDCDQLDRLGFDTHNLDAAFAKAIAKQPANIVISRNSPGGDGSGRTEVQRVSSQK